MIAERFMNRKFHGGSRSSWIGVARSDFALGRGVRGIVSRCGADEMPFDGPWRANQVRS